jgi:hypothetical protein
MRYPQRSKSFFSSVGLAQVQAVDGGEFQKELATYEAYYSDERRDHAKVVHADWHQKHADGEENE